MLFNTRLRLISIGASKCRAENLDMSFSSPDGRPSNSILVLRNGGGKTALLGMYFAHLLPHARDFLKGKSKHNATLADHVRDNDTSHVVAEWVGTELIPGTEVRFVTGMVAERNRGSGNQLNRWFYTCRSSPALNLDNLPWQQGGNRLGVSAFKAELERIAAEHPEISLKVDDNQETWRRMLEDIDIDQEVIRYQKRMNEGEADASNFMDFRTSDQFVERLLRVVTPAEELEQLAETVSRYSAKIRHGPLLDVELRLIESIAGPMRGYVESLSRQDQLSATLSHIRQKAVGLFSSLKLSAREASASAAADRLSLERYASRQRELSQSIRQVEALSHEVTYRLALREEEEAAAGVDRRQREYEEANSLARAWALVEPLTELAQLDTLLAELGRAKDAEIEDAQPLLEARDRAGRVLEEKLSTAAQELERLAANEAARSTEQAAHASALRQQALEVRDRRLQLGSELEQATARLLAFDRSRAEEREAGNIGPEDSVAAALERWHQRDAEIAKMLSELREHLSELRKRYADTERARRTLVDRYADLESDLTRVQERAQRAREAQQRVCSHAAIPVIWETDLSDPWTAAAPLAARALEREQRCQQDLVELEVEAQEDRRAMSSLERTGLLPPNREVELALEVLRQGGIRTAYAGWRYLEQSVVPEQREELLRAVPALAGGLVVNDEAELRSACELLAASALRATTVIGIDSVRQFAQVHNGQVGLWMPNPALYDQQAGKVESELRQHRVEGIDERKSRIEAETSCLRDLRLQLAALLRNHPHEQVQADVAQIALLSTARESLASELRDANAGLATTEQQRDRLEADERSLADERPVLADRISRMRSLAEEETQEPALRSIVADAPAEIARLRRQEEDRQRQAKLADDKARALGSRASGHHSDASHIRDEAAGIQHVPQTPLEDALADLSIKQLEILYRRRAEAYFARLSASVVAARIEQLEERRPRLTTATAAEEPEVLERARELATSELATSAAQIRSATQDCSRNRDRELIALTEAKATLRSLQERRSELEKLRGEVSEEIPEDLSRFQGQMAARRTSLESEIRTVNNSIGLLRPRVTELDRRSQALKDKADSLFYAFGGQLEEIATDAFVRTPEEAEEEVRSLATRRSELAQQHTEVEHQLRGQAHRIQTEASLAQYSRLEVLQERFRQLPDTSEQAGALESQITSRLPALREELESVARDRELVAQRLQQSLKDAYRNITNAEKASILPEGLDAWTGLPFVEIECEPPRTKERWGAICEQVVSEFINRGDEQLGGLALLLEGVRRANLRGKFKVSMLQPDAILTTQRYPVEDLKFSEGQELTAAILLYCTFVNLRTRNRARVHQGSRRGDPPVSGTLLLDNPIGKASLGKLIDLQLMVANVTGVHLIVTTHVHDPEAMARFANKIGLRAAPAARGNDSYLVHEEAGGIQAAHVHRG